LYELILKKQMAQMHQTPNNETLRHPKF